MSKGERAVIGNAAEEAGQISGAIVIGCISAPKRAIVNVSSIRIFNLNHIYLHTRRAGRPVWTHGFPTQYSLSG